MKRISLLMFFVLSASFGILAQERNTLHLTPFTGAVLMIDKTGASGIAEGGPSLGLEVDYAIGKHWGLGLRGFTLGLFSKTDPFQYGWGGQSITAQYHIDDRFTVQANIGLPSGAGVTIGNHSICLEAFPAMYYYVLQLSYGYRFKFRP